MIYFNKKTYKILKAIYSCDTITSADLRNRFGDIGGLLIFLVRDNYIGAQYPDGTYAIFNDDSMPWRDSFDTNWFTLPRGDLIIEERRWRLMSWFVPVIISAVSLVISLSNMIR